MRKVVLEAILNLIFGTPKQKTSTTIIIHDFHVDKIEVNVNLKH